MQVAAFRSCLAALPRFSRSLVLTTVAVVSLSLASNAMATTTIGTIGAWDGNTEFVGFGYSTTGSGPSSTNGQTIAAPSGDTSLQSFSFKMKVPTRYAFRGEVYAWDAVNGQPTGPQLWESAPTSTTDDSVFQTITFSTGGLQLTAGQQYVLFVTLLRDANTAGSNGSFGYLASDSYADGMLVYSHAYPFSSLLSSTWDGLRPEYDFAFSATFVSYSISFNSPSTQTTESYKAGKVVPVAIQLVSDATPMTDAAAAALASAGKVTVAASGAQELLSQPMKYNKRTDQFTYNWRLARTGGTGPAQITVTGTGYPGAGSQSANIQITPAR